MRQLPSVVSSYEFFRLLEQAGIVNTAENLTSVSITAEAGSDVRIIVTMLAPEGLAGAVAKLAWRAA